MSLVPPSSASPVAVDSRRYHGAGVERLPWREGAVVDGFGAAVVRVGVDVVVAAGGAMLGAWPEPNRKPMTLPAGGA